jgi:hypothetical protein
MIPTLITPGKGLPDVLPPGVHQTSLGDLRAAFGWSDRRKWLLEGLDIALGDLLAANCQRIYLGGGFVTSADDPDDYDGCWDPVGVNRKLLHRMYEEMPAMKIAQKVHHRGELWMGNHQIPGFDAAIRFFQVDTRRGIPRKGILAISIV